MQIEAHEEPGVTSRQKAGRREPRRRRKEKKKMGFMRKDAILRGKWEKSRVLG